MKRGMMWPVAIAGVLFVTVAANVALLVAANDPDAVATEPDYYRKAVTWDSAAAVARVSAATGWRCDARIEAAGAERQVVVSIVDAQGAPVTGAVVHVTAIHNLASRARAQLRLAERGPGRYVAALPSPRPGLWELRVHGTRGAGVVVADLRRDGPPGGAR